MRKEEHPSLSLPPHLATRLLNRATARMPARTPLPAAGWTPATSTCAMPPCTRAPQAFPLGLGVLTGKGITAWQRALAGLTLARPGTTAPARQPPGTRPAQAAVLPVPVAAELISVLAAVALAAARPVPVTGCSSAEGDPDAPRYRGVEGDRRPPVQDGAFCTCYLN